MEIEISENRYHHTAYIMLPNGDHATVYQSVGYSDNTWGTPTVQWGAYGSCTPTETKHFAEALLKAAEIAAEWYDRVGQPAQDTPHKE